MSWALDSGCRGWGRSKSADAEGSGPRTAGFSQSEACVVGRMTVTRLGSVRAGSDMAGADHGVS